MWSGMSREGKRKEERGKREQPVFPKVGDGEVSSAFPISLLEELATAALRAVAVTSFLFPPSSFLGVR
jgi:hypothetical protein